MYSWKCVSSVKVGSKKIMFPNDPAAPISKDSKQLLDSFLEVKRGKNSDDCNF